MKIGIVTTWFERGAAYVSKQFMNVLVKTDDVFIYARGGEKYAKGNPTWDTPNVWWGKRNDAMLRTIGGSYINKKDFYKWVKQNGIEIVLFNEQRYYQPLLWCKDLGVKSVAYVDYYTEDTLPFFDAYDCLICNTQKHSFAMRHHKNSVYLKWGTITSLYKPSGENHDKLVFFHSAGMAPSRKGTDLLLKAYYGINDRKATKLVIHSQVDIISIFPELKSIIEELCNEDSLQIIDKTVSAPGLYYMGDIYVYPSRLDGIGLTLMEAISSGLPIITIDNAPMNEFVDDSFGKLCEVDYYYCRYDAYYWPISVAKISSLTDKLNWFVINKDRLNEMKMCAREYALRELDFNKNMENLHTILNDIKITHIDKSLIKKINKYDSSKFIFYRYMINFFKETLKKNHFFKTKLDNRKKMNNK